MWRGGDITVLPLKNAFKSSYPDRGTHVPRPRYTCIPTEVRTFHDRDAGQTHQNYSDKNCNISNCKTLIINVLDLLILDIFRIFIV